MRSTTLLGFAAALTLTLIGLAFAQEPVARQDVPATTGTIFQSQPSRPNDGHRVITVPVAPRAETDTSVPEVP
jgi:hypothetical protein